MVLLALLFPVPASAQEEQPPPPVSEVVADYLEHGFNTRYLDEIAVGICPSNGPWQRELFRALTSAELDFNLKATLIDIWIDDLATCDDPEFESWFYDGAYEAAAEGNRILFGISYVGNLERSPTPKNLAWLRQLATGTTLGDRERSIAAWGTIWNQSDEERARGLVSLLETGRIPQHFATRQSLGLAERIPAYFASLVTPVFRRTPELANMLSVTSPVASAIEHGLLGRDSPEGRAFLEALQEVAARPEKSPELENTVRLLQQQVDTIGGGGSGRG